MGSSFRLKVKTRKMNAFVAVLLLAVAVSANDRIIGGQDATSTSQAPFQVSLQQSGSHFCGASLISTTHVMSAGHCKISGAIARTTVAMEGLQYTTLAQKFSVASWEVHPDFIQSAIINYDYSVITLTSAVTLKSGVVGTIALPAEDKNSPEWEPSLDGVKLVDATQSSQPTFKSLMSHLCLMLIAVLSGELSQSPHNPNVLVLEELDHATETLAVHSGKKSTASTTLSETPHGVHLAAMLILTQLFTPRTPLSSHGSNLKCNLSSV